MLRVLVIDDDSVDVYLLRHLVPGELAEIEHATTLREGVARLRAVARDLVLVDLHLPDGSGPSNVSALRAVAGTTAVAVLSGATEPTIEGRCRSLGAVEFFGKGFDNSAAIVSFLRAMRSARESPGRRGE
ncbi:MAG: response regulator [Deltaproteobacteria bacterium]|nr:response regulator [Deltaproteobacteria bacterium]